MNCRKVNSLLSAYIDGELTGAEQLHVRRHLRSCGCCSDEHESLEQTKQILARLATRNPNPALEDRILQRIAEEASRPVPKFDVRGWWGLLGEPDRAALRSGAVFAVVALAALLFTLQPMRSSEPQQSQMAGIHRLAPRLEAQPPIPLRDMLELHDVGGAAQPASTGVIPVSNVVDGGSP